MSSNETSTLMRYWCDRWYELYYLSKWKTSDVAFDVHSRTYVTEKDEMEQNPIIHDSCQYVLNAATRQSDCQFDL